MTQMMKRWPFDRDESKGHVHDKLRGSLVVEQGTGVHALRICRIPARTTRRILAPDASGGRDRQVERDVQGEQLLESKLDVLHKRNSPFLSAV